MRRNLIVLGGLFVLVSLFIFGISINSAQAAAPLDEPEKEPCFYLKNCPVPAPTIVVPESNLSIYADSLIITGLSWNETLVDVYIDGVYNGRAVLNLDDSGVGNFAYKTFLPLTPGEHTIYTVARNLNAKERSIESKHISFVVLAGPVSTLEDVIEHEIVENPVADEENEPIIQDTEKEGGPEFDEPEVSKEEPARQTGTQTGNAQAGADAVGGEERVVVVSEEDDSEITVAPEQGGEVSVSEGSILDTIQSGQIGGGISMDLDGNKENYNISDLQKTVDRERVVNEFFSEDEFVYSEQRSLREKQNRQIGFAMLGVIIVISIVWTIINSQKEKQQNDVKVADDEIPLPEFIPGPENIEDVMDDELDKFI